jgi:hypothetical protein
MKKTHFILLTCLFHLSISAQVAGYLGKRCSIGYDNYFGVSTKGTGFFSHTYREDPAFMFNTTHCLNIDYTITQRTNFCLSGQYFQTGIPYAKEDDYDYYGNENYPYPNETRYGGSFANEVKLRSFNIGLGFKFFKKGYVAPIGRYRKLEFLVMLENVKYDNKHFYKLVDDNDYYTIKEVPYIAGSGSYNYKNIGIAYTLGRQRIISNIIILDYGIRFGFIPGSGTYAVFSERARRDMEDYYRARSWGRLNRQQLINFHIGIGFLAF